MKDFFFLLIAKIMKIIINFLYNMTIPGVKSDKWGSGVSE